MKPQKGVPQKESNKPNFTQNDILMLIGIPSLITFLFFKFLYIRTPDAVMGFIREYSPDTATKLSNWEIFMGVIIWLGVQPVPVKE